MSFEADMIVPRFVQDDLGQSAKASSTFLRYAVTLRARPVAGSAIPLLEVTHEQLDYLPKRDAHQALPFAVGRRKWIDSVCQGQRTSPFISTEAKEGATSIRIHEDSGHQGRARVVKADGLARTLLSTLNTAETPTALAVRREMQSWRLLQLEPSRLRNPDEMSARSRLAPDGQGLAATLSRLMSAKPEEEDSAVGARLGNRLLSLIDDVTKVWVDRDEKREILTLMARSRAGVDFRARDLSDGTLRFLALAVLEQDPTWGGLLCMEEPENGIHPSRVPAILDLLESLAVDLDAEVNEDNPLRQVIINTHSPEVVGLVPDDSMLFADHRPLANGSNESSLVFLPLSDTWRVSEGTETVSRGTVLEMLQALGVALRDEQTEDAAVVMSRRPSVAAREDIRQLMMFSPPSEE
jgi:predicted ATPase